MIISPIPSINSHCLTQDDRLVLLFSDGLSEKFTNQAILNFIIKKRRKYEMKTVLQMLFKRVTANSQNEVFGKDNITCISIEFK